MPRSAAPHLKMKLPRVPHSSSNHNFGINIKHSISILGHALIISILAKSLALITTNSQLVEASPPSSLLGSPLPQYVNSSSFFIKQPSLFIDQQQLAQPGQQHQPMRGQQQTMSAGAGNSAPSGLNSAECASGLLTFELSTGFIYKPAASETLATLPSTLQLTDCLAFCLQNSSCLAINFEMGLCVLLSSSVKHNASQLYSSQFPVFTIYAEKLCLFSNTDLSAKQRRRCPRAWTFERVAGFEMKLKPRKRLKLATKEICMEACLSEREFECRSANWYRHLSECTLSDQDRHSVSQQLQSQQQQQQHLNSLSLNNHPLLATGLQSSLIPVGAPWESLYGPSNATTPTRPPAHPPGLYQNYYHAAAKDVAGPDELQLLSNKSQLLDLDLSSNSEFSLEPEVATNSSTSGAKLSKRQVSANKQQQSINVGVDYLENNCIQEPNKLCEFGKIPNRVLKTVDSIYQDVNSLEECKQKCLSAPYRCHSFDYGDTSERVCRTSHLDQASLLTIKEPYLEVAGAVTYELQACFNVSVQCKAREMIVQVSSSKLFRGRIYAKSRPQTCLNDVTNSGQLKFELAMKYHEPQVCDVKLTTTTTTTQAAASPATSSAATQTSLASNNKQQQQQQPAPPQQGMFSSEIIIQHHDRIVTSQDVGLQVFCQYDLSDRSIVSTVDLAVERLTPELAEPDGQQVGSIESKTSTGQQSASGNNQQQQQQQQHGGPITITSLATTVVKSPNVVMKITNLNGQPVGSATVGDRLALMFEIKEKTTPFGIFVRDIIAMDGKQLQLQMQMQQQQSANNSMQTTQPQANTLDDLINKSLASNSGQSIQLIDGDGCPTDSNIMGQLVKLDPAGRRYLAPFDAFKFPSSDVVFFRAVITTCVAECRLSSACVPATANSGGGPTAIGANPVGPALLLDNNINPFAGFTNRSAATMQQSPVELSPAGSTASTRNLINNQKQQQFVSTTTTLTTGTSFSSTSTTTLSPIDLLAHPKGNLLGLATSINQSTPLIQTNRDSTTTIAGFGSPHPNHTDTRPSLSLTTNQHFNSLPSLVSADESKFAPSNHLQSADSDNFEQNNNRLSKQPLTSPATPLASSLSPLPAFPSAGPTIDWLTSAAAAAAATSGSFDNREREPESRSSVSPPQLPPIEILNDLQRDLLVKLLKETRRRVSNIESYSPSPEQATSTSTQPTLISPSTENLSISNRTSLGETRNAGVSRADASPEPESVSRKSVEEHQGEIEAMKQSPINNTSSESLLVQIDRLVKRLEAASKSAKQQQQHQSDELSRETSENELENEVTTINVAQSEVANATNMLELNYHELSNASQADANMKNDDLDSYNSDGGISKSTQLHKIDRIAGDSSKKTNASASSAGDEQNFDQALDETLQEHLKKLERIARQSMSRSLPFGMTGESRADGEDGASENPISKSRKRREVASPNNIDNDSILELDNLFKQTNGRRLFRQQSKWDPSIDEIFQASILADLISSDDDYQEQISRRKSSMEPDVASTSANLKRSRRDTASQTPATDDSLLVQSIKILDRMEFEEGNDNANNSTKRRQFVAKNSLVTGTNKQRQSLKKSSSKSSFKSLESLPTSFNNDDNTQPDEPDDLTNTIEDPTSDNNNAGWLSYLAKLYGRSNWTTLTLLLAIASISFFMIQFLLIFSFAYLSDAPPKSRLIAKNILSSNGNDNPPYQLANDPYCSTSMMIIPPAGNIINEAYLLNHSPTNSSSLLTPSSRTTLQYGNSRNFNYSNSGQISDNQSPSPSLYSDSVSSSIISSITSNLKQHVPRPFKQVQTKTSYPRQQAGNTGLGPVVGVIPSSATYGRRQAGYMGGVRNHVPARPPIVSATMVSCSSGRRNLQSSMISNSNQLRNNSNALNR